MASTSASVTTNGESDGFFKNAGAAGVFLIAGIIVVFVTFIIYARNLIKLLGWKKFFILIIIMSILNSLVGYISSCFGKKKKENFPVVGTIFFAIFLAILIGALALQYYIIKFLGYRNFIILISVLSGISAMVGYSRNCM